MELFDFIKVVFTDPVTYSSLTPGEKRKHYFMCQRRFAINFPMQANALQNLKINQAAVMDFWQIFLRKQYKFVPGWMYTKGVKKAQAVKEKQIPISKEVIKEYCRYFQVDSKSVYDAIEFYPKEMIQELHAFSKYIK